MSESTAPPLAGFRVLDLSRVLAGPWASQMLADFGAEVIKVEHPQLGDDTRKFGPPWIRTEAGAETEDAAYFASANRGKRSLTLDLKHEQGRRIALTLADRADILLENYKVGTLKRFGLDYATLSERNPRLIYCSISGFGQDGPRADEAGYDAMIQAMGGLMSITGAPDDEAGGGPVKVGVAAADIMAGMYASSAILAAVAERHRSGLGQYIDIALLDTQVAWLANQAMNYLVGGEVPVREGTAHPNIVPYQSFPVADGHMMLAVGNDRQFASLCALLELPELAEDERFASNGGRVRHRKLLLPMLSERLRQQPLQHWMPLLQEQAVPCAPINNLQQVFADPQVRHRGMRLDLPHSNAGTLPSVANPIRFARTPTRMEKGPPLHGEHSAEILAEELAMTAEEIAQLRRDGVI